jgi:hypothetical protein
VGQTSTVDPILKFDASGTLVRSFGAGLIVSPHGIFVDRGNNRIVIFDQDGKQLEVWRQFSRPSGIAIDKQDTIYVADSESESVSKDHDGWKRGIRIGSARDGVVTAFIPDPVEKATGTSARKASPLMPQGTFTARRPGRGMSKNM